MPPFAALPLTANLQDTRRAVRDVAAAVETAGKQLEADLAAKAAAKKQRSFIDELEEKIIATTAVVAAASGTPEQAREMLSKARAKAFQAAADGADTGALEAMVRQLEHLAKLAEEKRDQDSRRRPQDACQDDDSAAAIPSLIAIAKAGF